MKVQFTFKTPDVIDEAIGYQYDDNEPNIRAQASEYIRFGEYLITELDTDTGIMTIVRSK